MVNKVSAMVKKELEGIPEPFVVLILTQPSTHFNTYLDLIDFAINQEKMDGVCITITRTVSSLKNTLETKGISTEHLHFIDCISRVTGSSIECENCEFVSHPSNLTDISIALTNSLNKMGEGKKFLIVDSWSSLLIYNDQKKVLGFSNFIINKLRTKNINGFLITLQTKDNEEFVNSLSIFCDKVISL